MTFFAVYLTGTLSINSQRCGVVIDMLPDGRQVTNSNTTETGFMKLQHSELLGDYYSGSKGILANSKAPDNTWNGWPPANVLFPSGGCWTNIFFPSQTTVGDFSSGYLIGINLNQTKGFWECVVSVGENTGTKVYAPNDPRNYNPAGRVSFPGFKCIYTDTPVGFTTGFSDMGYVTRSNPLYRNDGYPILMSQDMGQGRFQAYPPDSGLIPSGSIYWVAALTNYRTLNGWTPGLYAAAPGFYDFNYNSVQYPLFPITYYTNTDYATASYCFLASLSVRKFEI